MATITIYEKTKVSIPFSVKQADGVTAYDLTGKRVSWSCATKIDQTPLLKKASDVGGVTITAPATNGVGTIDLLTTDALPAGTYATTLWVDSLIGDDQVVSQDTLVVTGDVSRT